MLVSGCGGGAAEGGTLAVASPEDAWDAGTRGSGETYRRAFQTVGRWPQLQASPPGELTVRCAANFSPDARRAVEEAAEDWRAATRGRVRFRMLPEDDTVSRADITVATAATLGPPDGPTAAGFSWMERDTGDKAPEGTILWARVLFVPAASASTPGGLRGVLRHEFGHALGIGGHSPYGSDLMNPHGTGPITDRDVRTLGSVYGFATGGIGQ